MKGKFKRKKGHFSVGHQSPRKGLKFDNDVKKCEKKITYLRLKKNTHDKVLAVPRNVQHHMVDSGLHPASDTHVLLRPGEKSQNEGPINTKQENSHR